MKRLLKYFIFFGCSVVIIKFSRNILHLLKIGEEVKIAEQKLLELKQKNQGLKVKLDYYQSDGFVEEEARNKLNMARSGESIVILPPDLGKKLASPDHPDLPNYRKWWRLFFNLL
jgi:cell division protein FtsB